MNKYINIYSVFFFSSVPALSCFSDPSPPNLRPSLLLFSALAHDASFRCSRRSQWQHLHCVRSGHCNGSGGSHYYSAGSVHKVSMPTVTIQTVGPDISVHLRDGRPKESWFQSRQGQEIFLCSTQTHPVSLQRGAGLFSGDWMRPPTAR